MMVLNLGIDWKDRKGSFSKLSSASLLIIPVELWLVLDEVVLSSWSWPLWLTNSSVWNSSTTSSMVLQGRSISDSSSASSSITVWGVLVIWRVGLHPAGQIVWPDRTRIYERSRYEVSVRQSPYFWAWLGSELQKQSMVLTILYAASCCYLEAETLQWMPIGIIIPRFYLFWWFNIRLKLMAYPYSIIVSH